MQKIFQKSKQEKSDLLSQDLQNVEARIDLIKQVCQNVSKKILACLRAPNESDKTNKKTPESVLSKTLMESGASFSNEDTLGRTFLHCGEAQQRLANALKDYEADIEKAVLDPVQALLERDIPAITKSRKQLAKQAQELESIKSRFQSQQRQTTSTSQQQSAASKIESLREEMEDTQTKLEQSKDQFATEMYIFVSNEYQLNHILFELIDAQARYHRHVLAILKEVLPQLKQEISASIILPVYGRPLEEHLRRTNRTIALVIEESILALSACGLEEEGLFRISSGASRVRKLRAAFDADMVNMNEYLIDPHCITGCLKQYLRELPEPLVTFKLYSDWVQAMRAPTDQRVNVFKTIVAKMPDASFENLRYVVKFASKIAKNSSVNKMTTSNLAIVFGPTLMWADGGDEHGMSTSGVECAVVEVLISHADELFPIDIDFSRRFEKATSRVVPAPSRHAPTVVPESAALVGATHSRFPPNVPFVPPILDVAVPSPSGTVVQSNAGSALVAAGMAIATSCADIQATAASSGIVSSNSPSGSVLEVTVSGSSHAGIYGIPVAAPRRTLNHTSGVPTESDTLTTSTLKAASSDNSLDKLNDTTPFTNSPAVKRAARKSAPPPPPSALALAPEVATNEPPSTSGRDVAQLPVGNGEASAKPTPSHSSSLFAAKQALIGNMLDKPKIKTPLTRPTTEYEKVSSAMAEEKRQLSQTNEGEDEQLQDDRDFQTPKTRIVENRDMVVSITVEGIKKPRSTAAKEHTITNETSEENGHFASELRWGSGAAGKDGSVLPDEDEGQHRNSNEARKKPERPAKPVKPPPSVAAIADLVEEKILKIDLLESEKVDGVGIDDNTKNSPKAQTKTKKMAPSPVYSEAMTDKAQRQHPAEELSSSNGVDAQPSHQNNPIVTTSNNSSATKPPKPPPPTTPPGQKPRGSSGSEGDIIVTSPTPSMEVVEHATPEEDTYF